MDPGNLFIDSWDFYSKHVYDITPGVLVMRMKPQEEGHTWKSIDPLSIPTDLFLSSPLS